MTDTTRQDRAGKADEDVRAVVAGLAHSPGTRKRLGMVIDTARCIGCRTCVVACKVENNLPDGIWWNRVLTLEGDEGELPTVDSPTPPGAQPDLSLGFMTLACQHCEEPACVPVCEPGATWKDEATGIVMIDQAKCTGCEMCIQACPYPGVRTLLTTEPEYATGHPMGAASAAAPMRQYTVSKCTLCAHRVADGEQPACIESCPARARTFGDFNDPDSAVSQLIRDREYFQLLPEAGTRPNMYFLT